jgi:hypothetical protein
MQHTPAPTLEPVEPTSWGNCCRWIQRLHRRDTRTPQAAPSLPQSPPAVIHTGHLQWQRILVRKLLHIPTVPLTHVYTHTVSIPFLHKSPFKIVTRKTQLSPKSRWSGLYSVLITEWDQLGMQSGLLFLKCRVKAGLVSWAEGESICRSSCYISVSG